MNKNYMLITGASAGIGKEMAVICATKGFNLLLVSLPGSNLPSLAGELRGRYGIEVRYLEADLTKENAAATVFNWCTENQYPVNAIINNVGIGGSEKFEHLSLSEIQGMIQLNIYVVASITNLFIPLLKKQTKAYILNVSSTASYFSIPNKTLYAATKAFVNTFTTSLRNELKGTNISVSLLCPGGSAHKVDENVEKKLNKTFSRMVHETPEAIAKAGIDGMLKEKRLILPGIVSKLYVFFSKLIPVLLADFIVRKLFRPATVPSAKKSRAYNRIAFAACILIIASVLLNKLNFTGSAENEARLSLVVNDPAIAAYTPVDDLHIAFVKTMKA